jgi:hypothetical protein
MHFRITGDIEAESGLGQIITSLSGPTRQHFLTRDYGIGLLGIGVVLVCQDPNLNLKQRIRFSRKEKQFYLDIMLDLEQMQKSPPKVRTIIVLRRIAEDVPAILTRYKVKAFDEMRFGNDLREWLNAQASE